MNARYLKIDESLQYGDMYHNITVISNDDVGKLAKIQYTFMRPIELDMEGGKYRLLEKQDHLRFDIEFWNEFLDDWYAYNGTLGQGFVYRVPVVPAVDHTEGGKYRMATEADKDRDDIEVRDVSAVKDVQWKLRNKMLQGSSFFENTKYRVPVTPEPVQEVKENDRQCACKVTPSGIHGAMFLFPQKKCPVKAHSAYSQLQGSKRDLGDITKAKPPFMMPTQHECYNNLVNNYDQEGFAGIGKDDEFAINKTLDFINARYSEYLK